MNRKKGKEKMKKIFLLITITASFCFAERIGVLKGDKNLKCDEEILIDLDTEDSNGDTHVVSGSTNPPGISLGGHAKFKYCVVDSKNMSRVGYDFAVLSLDNNCPSGTVKVGRHHDCEDSNNANSYTGNIYPNIVNNNATLFYCFVPKTSNPKQKYPFKNKNYGVFANVPSSDSIAHSEIKIDDQDSHKYLSNFSINLSFTTDKTTDDNPEPKDKPNGWAFFQVKTRSNVNEWYYESDTYVNRIKKIMSGSKNTTYHVIKWTARTAYITAKTANAEYANTSSTINNQTPIAATIKNITRTEINIDLKTAGDIDISMMNINGSLVSKITKENMQPGVHSINWNLENIPNGSYIAIIKQNNMVRSKKVVLK